VKRAAAKHQVLRLIDYIIPNMVWLFTHASPTGTCAWVGQGPSRDAARPAAFHSRKLTPSQKAYSTHHQEALAIVEAIASFEYLLRNRHFRVVTDHESLTKIMTQKTLSGRQQRWLTFLSQFDFRIEYQPGTENFLADYLSRIHEGKPNPTDITLRDPTSQDAYTDALPDTQTLSIDTYCASSLDYPTDSEDHMYYTSDEKPSPTLTSYNSILHSSPEYLMNETASYSVTHSQTSQNPSNKCKNLPQSSPSTSPTDSADSYWEDSVLSPSPSKQEKDHSETSWGSCTNYDIELHSEEKAEASYWPKDARQQNQSKKAKGKRATTQGPIAPQKELSYSPPKLPYLSEQGPPLRMEESLLDTPSMASPAFGPLYNDPEDNQAESSQAQLILDSLNACRHSFFRDQIRQALELDPHYAKVKETGNKLHYSIPDGLLLAQNTNGYQNFIYL